MTKELTKKDIKEVFVESLEPFAESIQEDFQGVNKRLDSVDGRLTNIEKDVRWMKENSSELFTKLDRFIALYEKQEQELAALGLQLRRLEERVGKLEAV
ncbi:hypothetical protein MYX06_02810 [Patescibacteria group bacterium AH-259-L05]|nr:hypothetical protein [Patescibacteria group bacterium AH-259-L05]